MLYIGNFIYVSAQQNELESDRRHGEFNLLVETDRSDAAIDLFRERIEDLRHSSDFFEGECSIFFNQLIEFDRVSDGTATLINFKSVAGDPQMPFIGCTLPSDVADDCRIFDWDAGSPAIDGEPGNPFMVF